MGLVRAVEGFVEICSANAGGVAGSALCGAEDLIRREVERFYVYLGGHLLSSVFLSLARVSVARTADAASHCSWPTLATAPVIQSI